MSIEPTDEDKARDLLADLARAAISKDELFDWGEMEDREWMGNASRGWQAAIRRALHAEAKVKQLEEGFSPTFAMLVKLYDAIRKHRDQRGDDRNEADNELYSLVQ